MPDEQMMEDIERTRVIVHLIDLAPMDETDPVHNHEVIRRELHAFSSDLADKPEVTVFNKIDLIPEAERDALVRRTAHAIGLDVDQVIVASGASGINVREILERAWTLVRADKDAPAD